MSDETKHSLKLKEILVRQTRKKLERDYGV